MSNEIKLSLIQIANLPSHVAQNATDLKTGIYFGYASVGSDMTVYQMVMSYGWNPFYKNEQRTAVRYSTHPNSIHSDDYSTLKPVDKYIFI